MNSAFVPPALNGDSGLTLVEALVALAISSFVIVALGNLVWFVVGQERRLALSEADIRQAAWFAQTIDRIVEEADPSSIRLEVGAISLTTTGVPLSLARDRAIPIKFPLIASGGLQSLTMDANVDVSAELQGDDRRQPLLSQLTKLAISIRSGGAWLDGWQGRGPLPDAVRFSWQRVGGSSRTHIAYVRRQMTETACIRDPQLAVCVRSR
ncbi:prepilin-type N-terminal cleavage/methylation domain-containing protein [Labrys sp. 22185]|uniref:prepilin-type N-terminal cleavage/methylation domain-containing protein n=1 Tax=Labrys sp. 22185 TaxID=3453888 RepID=UPI003F832580